MRSIAVFLLALLTIAALVGAEGQQQVAEAVSAPPAKDGGCPVLCTRQFAPVCGTDSKTYANECLLKVADCRAGLEKKSPIKVATKGECKKEAEDLKQQPKKEEKL